MYLGPVMIDLEGTTLSRAEAALLRHASVGGVILFSRNYKEIKQLKVLVEEIRSIAGRPLLITVDHEGGRVWRFKEGFSKLPPAQEYGLAYDAAPERGLAMAQSAGELMASELVACGIDLSLAPVLDVDTGVSEVIGDRAFHTNPQLISLLARAFITGMRNAGMPATGKHFPGHGGCKEDSHIAQAIDNRSLTELMARDLVPFQELSPFLGAIMPAHVIYPKVDPMPAGFSKRWLQEILRQQLEFQGAIISDCLSMKAAAIANDFVVRARMALDAGCDMVILCQQERSLVASVLDNLERETNRESNQRLSALLGKF
jgi:beta-N-acetylhexosaminidase